MFVVRFSRIFPLNRRNFRRLRRLIKTQKLHFFIPLLSHKILEVDSSFNVCAQPRENRRYLATGVSHALPGPHRRRLLKQTSVRTQSTSTSNPKSPQQEAEEFIEQLYKSTTDPQILKEALNKSQPSSSSKSFSESLFLLLRHLFRFRGPFALRDPKTLQEIMQTLFKNKEYLKALTAFEKARPEARASPAVQKLYFDALVEAHNSRQLSLFEYFAHKTQKGENFFNYGQLGSSPSNPLYIFKKRDWIGIIAWVLLYLVLFMILYFLIFRNENVFKKVVDKKYSFVEKSTVRFSDVKGNPEAIEDLRDIVDYLKNPKKYQEYNIKIPKGVLLIGPPGTGKTLLARAVAGEAGCSFIATSGSEFEELFVGLGASRIRDLFNIAKKNAPCIIFIDEVDAIAGRRDDAFGRYTRMSLNQLLSEMDGFQPSNGVIVMAATNMPEILDPAFIRPGRFDRKVRIELPDRKARKEILDHYLRGKRGEDVDTESLAGGTPGFSGADLENMVNWATIEAAKMKMKKVSQKLLETALLNVAMGRERKSLAINPETRRMSSYHEAGHALVALYTPGAQTIRLATLIPRSHALGMVSFMEKDDLLKTKRELLAQIDTAMGGRAAEELIYGPQYVTQGAGSDLQSATAIARTMVYTLGMSEKLGLVTFTKGDGPEKFSPETVNLAEQEVRRILDESYQRAKNLLISKKHELHLLADALLKYETLTLDQIKLVISGKPLQILENQNKAQDLTKENPRNDENERQKRHEELGKEGTEELRKLFREKQLVK